MTAPAAAAGAGRAGAAAEVAGAVAAARTAPRRPASRPPGRSAADTGAGFVLGLLLWGWVVLPFLQRGPTGVRDVIRAKFVNKGPDGEWLP